jgi:hypothetical protein
VQKFASIEIKGICPSRADEAQTIVFLLKVYWAIFLTRIEFGSLVKNGHDPVIDLRRQM